MILASAITTGTVVAIGLTALVVIAILKTATIVPQKNAYVVERLGKYYATLKPGINIIIPFIDRAKTVVTMTRGRYIYSSVIDLREQVYDFDK